MKALFATCLLVSSVAVCADTGRDLYDVMYLPKANTTYGFTTGTWSKATAETDLADVDYDGYMIQQTIGHSFSDSFSLEGSMNYLNLDADMDGGIEANKSGFSDLTVAGRYRLMDASLRLDIVGGALISTGDHEIKTDGDANNINGGNNYFVGAQIGQKHASYQWSLLAQYTFHDQTYTDAPGDLNMKEDQYNSGLVRADLLNRLAEKSFLRSHLLANFSEKNVTTDFSTGRGTDTYELGAEYQHLCSENFLARAGVDYQMQDMDASSFDSYNAWKFTIGANYQF